MILKQKQIFTLILTALLFISACTAARVQKSPETKSPAFPSEPDGKAEHAQSSETDMEIFRQKMGAALEKAKRSGDSNVDIYLEQEDPDKVQINDLVSLHCLATLDDGQVISVGRDSEYGLAGKRTIRLIAGEEGKIPGLGRAILGMGLGKKQVTIPPENAFGNPIESKQRHLPRVKTMPLVMGIDVDAYKKRFKSLPLKKDKVQINPYFESEVIDLTDSYVLIRNLVRDGYVEQAPFGKTTISVNNEVVTIQLTPLIGAYFNIGDKRGRIVSFDDKTFVVDFNHPYAGKALHLDLEVTSIIKTSAFRNMEISWITDHDMGYEIALKEKKDRLLVLYADWCQWCKKLFKETFEDPRIKMFNDRFVFVKANSDKDPSLKELYGQKGFPMIVLTDYKGKIYKKMEGYKDAPDLLNELERIANPNQTEADR